MERAINRNDVAKRAGVAPSTVSHVINGTKYVSDNVKERVLRVIQELDYEPNLLARSFKTNSTKQITVLVSSLDNFEELYRGMYETAFDAGYSLSVVIANDNRVNYYSSCYAHRIEGIINLSRFFCDEKEYKKLIAHNVAVVNVLPGRENYEVGINYVNAIETFINKVLEKGRTRIAFLADTSRAEIEPDTRLIATRYFLEKAGYPLDDSLLRCFEDNTVSLNPSEFGYTAMNDVLDKCTNTNAVYCVNDYVALGAYKSISEHGLRVPDDISICGCDDILVSCYMTPSISSMGIDKVEFGRNCMVNILEQLKGNWDKERKIILFADYLARNSV
mgnify:CR=1 FL=1